MSNTTRLRLMGGVCVAVLALMSGCANYAQFQTAETVGRDELRQGLGVTATAYDVVIEDESESVFVPAVSWWLRYGITEELELHANLWMPLGASVGGKYHVLGSQEAEGFDLSLGLDIGALQLSAGSGDAQSTVTILDFYVPIYVGYRVSESFAVYATPKYILRTAFGDGTGFANLLGSTLGVALGSDTQFYAEGSFFWDLDAEASVINGGLGVMF